MAFAIASRARPEQGIYTAIVAGLCTSLLGVTSVQISGPTGAYIAVHWATAALGVIALLTLVLGTRYFKRVRASLLLTTFLLTVFSDLGVAVNVGVVLASLLFMRRMAQSVSIEELSETQVAADFGLGEREHFVLPKDTVVYSIDGPLFFGAAENLEKTLRRSQNRVCTLVIRMRRVPFMDNTRHWTRSSRSFSARARVVLYADVARQQHLIACVADRCCKAFPPETWTVNSRYM